MSLERVLEWGTSAADWAQAHQAIALIIGGVLVLVLLGQQLRGLLPVTKDPVRLFSPAQRAEIHARAGGRCEHKAPLGMRCSRRGTQADHIFPWSKGGATALENGASLCAGHNRSKSAKIPTWSSVRRLERRRRSYFPPGVNGRVIFRR